MFYTHPFVPDIYLYDLCKRFFSSDSKNMNCATPSFAYILAGSGVVLKTPKLRVHSHSGSLANMALR